MRPKDQTRVRQLILRVARRAPRMTTSSVDMLRDHRKIRAARTGIDRFLQNLADQFGAADFDARRPRPVPAHRTDPSGHIRSKTRVRENCPARSPSCRDCAAQNCRPSPSTTYRARAPDRRRCVLATATASASALTVSKQHHVVEDLGHLPGADVAAIASRRWQSSGSGARSRRTVRATRRPSRSACHPARPDACARSARRPMTRLSPATARRNRGSG